MADIKIDVESIEWFAEHAGYLVILDKDHNQVMVSDIIKALFSRITELEQAAGSYGSYLELLQDYSDLQSEKAELEKEISGLHDIAKWGRLLLAERDEALKKEIVKPSPDHWHNYMRAMGKLKFYIDRIDNPEKDQ